MANRADPVEIAPQSVSAFIVANSADPDEIAPQSDLCLHLLWQTVQALMRLLLSQICVCIYCGKQYRP